MADFIKSAQMIDLANKFEQSIKSLLLHEEDQIEFRERELHKILLN